MSYLLYKVIHLFGIFLLMSSLGVLCAVAIGGGNLSRAKKFAGIGHGAALVLILVAGFGLVARLGLESPFPLWVWLKIGLWFAFGAAAVVIKKVKDNAAVWIYLVPLLGAVAAYLAIFKVG
jgi:hypothetical protein